jgi:hypothetical protein
MLTLFTVATLEGEPGKCRRLLRDRYTSVRTPHFSFFLPDSRSGWVDVMENAIDCVGEGQAPSRSHNPVAALFFVAYIVVVAFFMLNVFVGYVIITFRYVFSEPFSRGCLCVEHGADILHSPICDVAHSEEGERAFKDSGLDKNQRKCIAFCIKARPTVAHRPQYRVQVRG